MRPPPLPARGLDSVWLSSPLLELIHSSIPDVKIPADKKLEGSLTYMPGTEVTKKPLNSPHNSGDGAPRVTSVTQLETPGVRDPHKYPSSSPTPGCL